VLCRFALAIVHKVETLQKYNRACGKYIERLVKLDFIAKHWSPLTIRELMNSPVQVVGHWNGCPHTSSFCPTHFNSAFNELRSVADFSPDGTTTAIWM
jgi:hypothetical protein